MGWCSRKYGCRLVDRVKLFYIIGAYFSYHIILYTWLIVIEKVQKFIVVKI
jgi:hypothetical protein